MQGNTKNSVSQLLGFKPVAAQTNSKAFFRKRLNPDL
jgi:hypothetical protein